MRLPWIGAPRQTKFIMKRLSYFRFALVVLLSFTALSSLSQDFMVDSIYYSKVYDEETGEYLNEVQVSCAGELLLSMWQASYSGDVVIPETVTYEGVTYTVTGVWGDCNTHGWQGPIYGGAFYNCTELTSIVLPSSIKWISGYAFTGCTSLTSFTCLATTPPELISKPEPWNFYGSQFFGDFCEQATLYVPASAVEAYKDLETHWSGFFNIVGIGGDILRGDADGDGSVGINDVTKIIDYLLNGNESSINLTAADADCDGRVAISDVPALIDYLLSKSW